MSGINRQKLHHVTLKIKHAFSARYPRTFIRDNTINRGIVDILQKQGFLSAVLPGDDRGPFVDIITTMQLRSLPTKSVLTENQVERWNVLNRMNMTLRKLHESIGSDGSKTVELNNEQRQKISTQFPHDSDNFTLPFAGGKQSPKSQQTGYMNNKSTLAELQLLPALSLVHVPLINLKSTATTEAEQKLTPQDLQYLTWPKDRRLWMDLRYDVDNQPAMTHMGLISKGSRKIYTNPSELKDFVAGKHTPATQQWNASEFGSVVMIYDELAQQVVTAREALRRGISGEVLCVAK